MNVAVSIAIKGVAGGALVVAFALTSEAVKPHRFSGLFGAAPAVALAGLTVTLLTKSPHDAREATVGMLAGCVGMLAYAAAAPWLLRRMSAIVASAVAFAAWLVPSAALAVALLT